MPSDQKDLNLLVMTILNLFILAVCGVVLLFILLINRSSVVKSSKLYYGTLILLLIGKLAGYLIYGFKFIVIITTQECTDLNCQLMKQFEQAYRDAVIITDLALVQMTFMILRQYFNFYCSETINTIPEWVGYLLSAMQIGSFVGFLVLGVIFNIKGPQSYSKDVTIGCTVINYVAVLAGIIVYVYLNIKLTGTTTDEQAEDKLARFKKLQFWVFLGRAIEGTLNLFVAIDIGDSLIINFIIKIQDSPDEIVKILAYFAIYLSTTLLTEGVTLALSVRKDNIELLSKEVQTSRNASSLITDINDDYIRYTDDEQVAGVQPSLRQFEFIEDIKSRPSSLGQLKKGRFLGKLSVIRQIECQLSKYLAEQVLNQIQERKQLNIPELLNIKYCLLQTDKVYFISDYCEQTLSSFIQKKKPLQETVKMAYKLVVSVGELHSKNMPHGTLKTANIYIHHKEIKIADHGLLSFKKFMKLTQGYSNKSFYTAPEFLAEKSLVVEKPTKAGDVYALGMIMFEMFTGNVQYRELTLQEVDQSFRLKEHRPKIPEFLPNSLKAVIRNCWQQSAAERPSIENIILILKQYCRF